MQTRPLTVMGAFAHGDYAAGGCTIARAFLETMSADVRYARALSRGALGTAASAATASAAASGSTDVAGAAAAGAAGAGEASLIGRVGALLMGPVGVIAAGLGIVAGAVVGVDTIRKQVAGQEYLLRGSVGGIGSGGDVAGFQGRLDAVGWRYMYKSADTLKAADALGAAGVTAGQMPGAVGNSMAFARTSGQDLSRVTALTSQLMVQGGMSATQVGAAYAQLQAAADQSGQSVAKLVTSLEDLLRTTGGGTQQINGLAAVQSILGTDPRLAAQVVGQPMASTGAQAINTAGLLGISTERLQKIQETGNTAQMYDLLAGFAKRTAGGRKDQTTIDYVESAMQGAGLLNLAGIDPKRATGIVRTMLGGDNDSRIVGPYALWPDGRHQAAWPSQERDAISLFSDPAPGGRTVITAPGQRERAAGAVGHVMKRGPALCAAEGAQPPLRGVKQDKGGYCTGTGGQFHARNGGTGPVPTPPAGTGAAGGAFYIATAALGTRIRGGPALSPGEAGGGRANGQCKGSETTGTLCPSCFRGHSGAPGPEAE